jgi:lysyl-tRNA synthetase class 2
MKFASIEEFKAFPPNKLFNDIGGMRKKLKIDAPLPDMDMVKSWQK